MPQLSIYVTPAPGGDGNAPTTEGVAVSGTSTYYSLRWNSVPLGISIHTEWNGTPTGTFTLWCSDKADPNLADDTDWVQDTAYSPTNPAGSASKARQTSVISPAWHKRLKYVNASGSGVLRGWVSGAGTAS